MLAADLRNVKQTAMKLHKQFGHPSHLKLIKLIKNAGVMNKPLEDEIERISENCEICFKLKKAPLRPVVSIPMATKFNEVVAMDLKVWGKFYFLVMVDLATRWCSAVVIGNKLPQTIIRGIFRSWITYFGGPKKFLTDNGREFDNEAFRELGEVYNIKIMTTAAQAPWSNGICERLNGVLGDHVQKIR